MADLIDKAVLIGTGLEQKLKELVVELEEKGKKQAAAAQKAEKTEAAKDEKAEGKKEKLEGTEKIENRVIEEGVNAIKEILSVLREGKDKIESDVVDAAETLTEKLNLATRSELEVVKEMARNASEKADKLEKKVKKLEDK